MKRDRNSLTVAEAEAVSKYRDMVVQELKKYIGDTDLLTIKCTPKDQLIRLNSSLGTAIRAEYELWMDEHEVTAIWKAAELAFPLKLNELIEHVDVAGHEVEVLVDNHPCHPENFSYSCIEQLWESLQ